jgi:hypothetical protein
VTEKSGMSIRVRCTGALGLGLLLLACESPPRTPLPPDGGSDVCTRLAYVFYLVAEKRERGIGEREQIEALASDVDNPFTLHPGETHEGLRRVVEIVYARPRGDPRELEAEVSESCSVDAQGQAVLKSVAAEH